MPAGFNICLHSKHIHLNIIIMKGQSDRSFSRSVAYAFGNIMFIVVVLDELSTLPCQWNYCFNYCHTGEPNSKCNAAETNGVRLLHGKVATFELNNQPMFRAMHMAFAEVILIFNL